MVMVLHGSEFFHLGNRFTPEFRTPVIRAWVCSIVGSVADYFRVSCFVASQDLINKHYLLPASSVISCAVSVMEAYISNSKPYDHDNYCSDQLCSSNSR